MKIKSALPRVPSQKIKLKVSKSKQKTTPHCKKGTNIAA